MATEPIKVRVIDTTAVRVIGTVEVCGTCGGRHDRPAARKTNYDLARTEFEQEVLGFEQTIECDRPVRIKRTWMGDEIVDVIQCGWCSKEEDNQKAWPQARIAFWPGDDD